jgi:hypothetical protein
VPGSARLITHDQERPSGPHQPLDRTEFGVCGPPGLDSRDRAGRYTGTTGQLALAQIRPAPQRAQDRTKISKIRELG